MVAAVTALLISLFIYKGLKLRELPRPGPWSWTLPLLRAANTLSTGGVDFVIRRGGGDRR